MAKLTIRIDFDDGRAVGHGKIRLLELIDAHGSIAAAGRAMDMSYRRAWLLVDDINHCFRHAVVTKQLGGSEGGGAALTPFGRTLIGHYHTVEKQSARATSASLRVLQAAAAPRRARRHRTKPDA